MMDKTKRNQGIYGQDKFIYDKETDTYVCPAGVRLKRRSFHESKQSINYSASRKDCSKCQLRPQCTRNKSSRSINRHLRQEELDQMRSLAGTSASKRDLKTRQHLMERSFARSKRYGFDRSRWRGLWRVQIQEYVTAAIQNIQALIRHGKSPHKEAISVKTTDRVRTLVYTYCNLLINLNISLLFGKSMGRPATVMICY
ncbi:MAG: transposase [Nitrospirae bacterium]|nr:transposase [Nitrospirota bacterium]